MLKVRREKNENNTNKSRKCMESKAKTVHQLTMSSNTHNYSKLNSPLYLVVTRTTDLAFQPLVFPLKDSPKVLFSNTTEFHLASIKNM